MPIMIHYAHFTFNYKSGTAEVDPEYAMVQQVMKKLILAIANNIQTMETCYKEHSHSISSCLKRTNTVSGLP